MVRNVLRYFVLFRLIAAVITAPSLLASFSSLQAAVGLATVTSSRRFSLSRRSCPRKSPLYATVTYSHNELDSRPP